MGRGGGFGERNVCHDDVLNRQFPRGRERKKKGGQRMGKGRGREV